MPLASVFTAVRAVVSPSGHLTKEQMEVLVRETGHSVFDLREVEVRLQRSLYAAAEAQALQLAGDVSDAESAFQAILQRDALHSIRKQIEESGNYEELDRIATAIGSLNR